MKLIVFGATGITGRELVKQALFNGHEVTAFGRNVFTEDFPENPHLHLVQGALFDEKEVQHALKNTDAVIAALDGARNGQDKTRSLGMKIITQQMKKAGINRIVALGGAGILDGQEGKLRMEEDEFPAEQVPESLEHRKAWEYLRAADLDYTLVCPSFILSGEPTGAFTTAENILPAGTGERISSGDLALCMLKILDQHLYSRCRVGIGR